MNTGSSRSKGEANDQTGGFGNSEVERSRKAFLGNCHLIAKVVRGERKHKCVTKAAERKTQNPQRT